MNELKKIGLGIVISILLMSCDNTDDPLFPDITTKQISNITFTTADSGGLIISDNGNPITAMGLCWSINPNPTISDNVILANSNNFTTNLNSLSQNGTYYVRAFATNAAGTGYGNEIMFNTWLLGNTKWAFHLVHVLNDVEWDADIDFYDDGTTKYDEPGYYGLYTTYGTWSVSGNTVEYNMTGDPLAHSYVFTGVVTNNVQNISGTYTFLTTSSGPTLRNFTGVIIP